MAKTKTDVRPKTVRKEVSSSTTPSKFVKYIPHIVALVTFIFITLIFFAPMLLDDKILPQGDINQFDGAAKEIMDFRAKNHQEPLWTNSMFGGMPAFQISTVYHGNLIQHAQTVLELGLPEFSGYLFVACVGFYLLLLVLGVNPWLAIAGAVAYSLASYNLQLIDAGHNSKINAIALLPYVATGFMLLWRRKYLLGGAMSAFGFSLLVSANHLQIAYYLFLVLFIAAIVFLIFAIREKDLRHYIMVFGIFGIAAGAGVASNLDLLWSTYEYGNSTIRGKSDLTSNTQSKGGLDRDYAFGWSYGKMEAMDLMIPNFAGGSSNQLMDEDSKTVQAIHGQTRVLPTYWGDQPFTSGPAYLGALMLFLFVLALVVVDGPFKWWLGIATLLGLMLAMGHNLAWFNNAFFDYFPGYNKFRTVTMSIVICQFTVPLLAIIALNKILNNEIPKERVITGVYIAAGITGGLCLIFALFGSSLLHFTGGGDKQIQPELVAFLKEDRISLLRSDAFRSLMLILVGAGAIWAYIQDKLSKSFVIGIILVACLFDYIGTGKRYLNNDLFTEQKEKQNRFAPSPADQAIMQDPSLDFRVFNTTVNSFNDASTSYYHKSAGGYHAAKLRRYQELIDHQISKGNMSVLNMLNTKYFIQKGPNGAPAAAQNPGACGNAWFVDNVQQVANADAEMDSLNSFDPMHTAFIDKKFAANLSGYSGSKDATSTIKLVSYQPNDLKYEYTATGTQVAVFSEIYYQPGWVATVDGKETPIMRADYVLRSMVLPAGSHKVEMKFEPSSYYTGEKVAMASSLLILLLVAGASFAEFKKEQKTEAA